MVVGGSGFIGRHLLEALSRQGHEVTAIYRNAQSFEDYARRLGAVPRRHDLLKEERTWDHEVGIYLAGNSNHALSISQPLEDLEMNLVALNRFLRGFPGNLIFLSSAAIYEGHEGLVHPKDSVYPSLPYAISKFASECYIRHYYNTGKISGYLILRLYYAYGPGEREGRLFQNLCRSVLQGGQRTFRVAGAGDSFLDPLHVDDVVDALVRALPHAGSQGVYDLCGGRSQKVRDLVKEVAAAFGVSVEIECDPSWKEVPIRFWSDPAPVRSAFGLRTPTPLKQGLAAYLTSMKGTAE